MRDLPRSVRSTTAGPDHGEWSTTERGQGVARAVASRFLRRTKVGKMRPPPNINEATSPLVVLSAKTQSDLTSNFPVDKAM